MSRVRQRVGVGAPISNVFEYLHTLPGAELEALYGSADGGAEGTRPISEKPFSDPAPWVCRAVLQSFPPLPKQIVMRLVCLDEDVPRKVVESWVQESFQKVGDEGLEYLLKNRVLLGSENGSAAGKAGAKGGAKVRLNPHFRNNLLRVMVHADIVPWRDSLGHPMKPDKDPPSLFKIESELHRRWERVLHLLVGSDPETSGVMDPPQNVVGFVQQAGLMAPTAEGGAMAITSLGFDFMLREINTQVWMFVLSQIRAQPSPRERKELLNFLFMLSACRAGEDYPLGALTDAQVELARMFIDLGLLYQRKASSTRFYTTTIAVSLIFGAPPVSSVPAFSSSESGLAIIVQTNYQIVAYTSNILHVAMISLFADLRVRLPNVIIGTISRESIMRALQNGIPARQILRFLRFHAHKSIVQRTPVVPENIADQISLWEFERQRVSYSAGVLLDLDLASPEVFSTILKFAEENGGKLWSAKEQRLLVVPHSSYKPVVKYADSLLG